MWEDVTWSFAVAIPRVVQSTPHFIPSQGTCYHCCNRMNVHTYMHAFAICYTGAEYIAVVQINETMAVRRVILSCEELLPKPIVFFMGRDILEAV